MRRLTLLSAEFDFAALPKARVPLLVVSPRRVLSEILSKGWVESTVPFLAFVCVIVGVLLTDQRLFQRRQLAQSRALRVRRRACRPGVVHRCRGRRHRPLGRVQFRHVGVRRALLLPHPEPAGRRRARREPRDRRGDRRRQRGAGRTGRLRRVADHARNDDHGPRDLHARIARPSWWRSPRAPGPTTSGTGSAPTGS